MNAYPEFKSVGWHGASWWDTPKKAIIAINILGKKEDKFWFTFFHETYHILRGPKRELSVECDNNVNKTDKDEESSADKYASEILIPCKYDDQIRSCKTKAEIQTIASQLNLSPGIVVGRYQRLTEQFKYFNELRKSFMWDNNSDSSDKGN